MSDEKVHELEADVPHLTHAVEDLMREVRRNAQEISRFKEREIDQEWEARIAWLRQPREDRLQKNLRTLREQSARPPSAGLNDPDN